MKKILLLMIYLLSVILLNAQEDPPLPTIKKIPAQMDIVGILNKNGVYSLQSGTSANGIVLGKDIKNGNAIGRGYLTFDLSKIPRNAKISNVRLYLESKPAGDSNFDSKTIRIEIGPTFLNEGEVSWGNLNTIGGNTSSGFNLKFDREGGGYFLANDWFTANVLGSIDGIKRKIHLKLNHTNEANKIVRLDTSADRLYLEVTYIGEDEEITGGMGIYPTRFIGPSMLSPNQEATFTNVSYDGKGSFYNNFSWETTSDFNIIKQTKESLIVSTKTTALENKSQVARITLFRKDSNGGFLAGIRTNDIGIFQNMPQIFPQDKLVCIDGDVTFSIPELKSDNFIVTWISSPKLSLKSGQYSNTVTYRGIESGYSKITATIRTKNSYITELKLDSIWLGPPVVKQKEHSYNDFTRNSIILDSSKDEIEGPHDGKGIWEYLSGSKAYTLTPSTKEGKATFKSKLQANQSGQTVLKFRATNACGSSAAAILHTINIEEAFGSSFDKPINTASNLIYDVVRRSDDVSLFENGIFYELSIPENDYLDFKEQKLIICVSGNNNPFYHIYNSKRELIKTVSKPGNGEVLDVSELNDSKFYIVVGKETPTGYISLAVENMTIDGASPNRAIPISINPLIQNKYCHFSDIRNLGLPPYQVYPIIENGLSNVIFYSLELLKPAFVRVHTKGSQTPISSFKHMYLANTPDTKPGRPIEINDLVVLKKMSDYVTHPISTATNTYYNYYCLEEMLQAGRYYIIVGGYRGKNNTTLPHKGENTITNVTVEVFDDKSLMKSLHAQENSSPELATNYKLKIGDTVESIGNTEEQGYFNLYAMPRTYDNSYYQGNVYAPSQAKELYHKITIEKPMDVVIHHAGSKLQNTMINLIPMNNDQDLDDFYSPMYRNSPMFSSTGSYHVINREALPKGLNIGQGYLEIKGIQPGTYCIVSEGISSNNNENINGPIIVNIEAKQATLQLRSRLEEKNISLLLTPNPTNSMVTIIVDTKSETINGAYQIMNISGALQQKGSLREKQTKIDVSSLPKGIYIVYAIVNGENLSTRLVVN